MTLQDLDALIVKQHVLVVGDVMIDAYLHGTVSRISPEAPVPIVDLQYREENLGGAANVALNIKAMGATPILCTAVGNDLNGKLFFRILKHHRLSSEGCIAFPDRTTTIKSRIMSNTTQMLRIDNEQIMPLSTAAEQELLRQVDVILHKYDIAAIIFQDYDKGVLTPTLIAQITQWANALDIPICVDPKKQNFSNYRNVALFKPNLKEFLHGIGHHEGGLQRPVLFEQMAQFAGLHTIDTMLVTMSDEGVALLTNNRCYHFKAHQRHIADVSGAGDTVISIATLCMTAGLPPKTMAQIANLAGGLVCEYAGVVPIDKKTLYKEISTHNILK
ncbi:carbohydrate kinase [Bacteroidia bacterium]|nr:carbohydrate kinase [Bacteroidia bacterium]